MSGRSRPSQHAGLAAREARRRGDVGFLVSLLANTEHRARVAAARQLGKLGSPDGVPALMRALQSVDTGLKITVLKALAEIGDPSAIDAVSDVGANPSEPFEVRASAARTLLRLGDRRGVSTLSSLLSAENVDHYSSFLKWAMGLLVEAKGVEALPALRESRAKVGRGDRRRLDRAIRVLERLGRP